MELEVKPQELTLTSPLIIEYNCTLQLVIVLPLNVITLPSMSFEMLPCQLIASVCILAVR